MWATEYEKLELTVKLFAVADKYGVAKMQDFNRLRFLEIYIKFFRRHRESRDELTQDDHDEFGEAILQIKRTIYTTTPSSQKMLRDVVVRTITTIHRSGRHIDEKYPS